MKVNLKLLVALFITLQLSAQSLLAQKKPNIVYILADDLGYGDIGALGQTKIETPNMDALAKNGMLFTQYYAFPVCAPSRYLLMTGKHSGHAYIRGNDEWDERGPVWNFQAMEANPALEGQRPIPDSTITIAEMCKKAGYTTAIVGKWGLGAPMTQGVPNRQGFDYFYGFICQREDHTYYPGHLWENDVRVPLDNKVEDPNVKFPAGLDSLDPANYARYQQKNYASDFLIDAALRFLDKNKSTPFFLYYASPLPHVSLQAPQKWIDYYHVKFGDEKPFLGGSYFPCRYPRATYAAMVSTLDEEIGKIVKKLKELNVYDNTLIVFTSDNGPASSAGTDSPWFNSGGLFKSEAGWGKGSVHEGGIRLPFIVQWPGKIKTGSKSEHVAATWDFMPTLCSIIGITPPRGIDGISYLPSLLGNSNAQQNHGFLYWEFPEYGGQQAVRLNNWKGIRQNIQKGNLKIELFDLSNDIREQNDVSADHPDIVKKIEQIMKEEHQTPAVSTFLMKALEKN
ncbi:MAG: arylsulfatase [Bacteroidetes bacterium]|nr:arylsulfatase [Bacteroidota bacterium]